MAERPCGRPTHTDDEVGAFVGRPRVAGGTGEDDRTSSEPSIGRVSNGTQPCLRVSPTDDYEHDVVASGTLDGTHGELNATSLHHLVEPADQDHPPGVGRQIVLNEERVGRAVGSSLDLNRRADQSDRSSTRDRLVEEVPGTHHKRTCTVRPVAELHLVDGQDQRTSAENARTPVRGTFQVRTVDVHKIGVPGAGAASQVSCSADRRGRPLHHVDGDASLRGDVDQRRSRRQRVTRADKQARPSTLCQARSELNRVELGSAKRKAVHLDEDPSRSTRGVSTHARHAASATTTCSCWSAVRCGYMGSDRIRSAAASATGNAPRPSPRSAYAAVRCSGVG